MSAELPGLVERIGVFFRGSGDQATAWEEIEALLGEGYAEVHNLEYERSCIDRSMSELACRASEGGTVPELRFLGARLYTLERQIRSLRSLLDELRDYGSAAQQPK